MDYLKILNKSIEQNQVADRDKREADKEKEEFFISPQNMSEQIEWEKLKMYKKDKAAERDMRKEYARKSFIFSWTWAIFIIILITLKGFGKLIHFEFSQTEFLVIIGALSATILGYYAYVVRYLFKDK